MRLTISIAAVMLLLSGCASYRVKPLRKLTQKTAQYTQEIGAIRICASRICLSEFKSYFNGMYFGSKHHFGSVLLTLHNNTKDAVVFGAHDVSLKLIPADELTSHLCCSSTWRVPYALLGAFGALGGGILLSNVGVILMDATGTLAVGFLPMLLGSILVFSVVPITIFADTCGAGDVQLFNHALRQDVCEKILSRILVAPGDSVSKLIITHKRDLEKPFVMSMRAIGTEKTTEFVVDLSTQEHSRD